MNSSNGSFEEKLASEKHKRITFEKYVREELKHLREQAKHTNHALDLILKYMKLEETRADADADTDPEMDLG